jgi:hypothetical protein
MMMPFTDPSRPSDLVMPATTQIVLIALFGLGAVATLAYVVVLSTRRKDLVAVYAVGGAALAIVYEPVADMLIHCYHPERGQIPWVHTFGLHIPMFIGLGYVWYMSAGALILLCASRRGISARQWWTGWVGFGVFAGVFEMACVQLGHTPWIYYGPQAFQVLGIPVLTTFNYVSFDLAIGAGVCALARQLPRRLQPVIVPAVPMLMAASHVATSLPLAIALNGTQNTTVIEAASLLTTALSAGLSYLLSTVFRTPWPPTGRQHPGEAVPAPAPRPASYPSIS